MIRFAVVGTNWITQRFIDAAHESGKMKLTAIYSRTLAGAKKLGDDYPDDHYFDCLEEMDAADAAVSKIHDWTDVHSFYSHLRPCDDGSISE